jgi:hypothetical protein
MAQGLGLTQGLLNLQQGMRWRENQDQLDLEKQRREKINAANQAAMGYVEEAKKAHEAEQAAQMQAWAQKNNGSSEGWKAAPMPTDQVMFRAAAKRGDALLGAGLFDEYAKNRAAIIPMQMQARRSAWERYQQDGDIGALGRSMYDTVPDGKHVKSYDMVDGAGPDGKAGGKKVRFQLDDGTVKMYDPAKLEEMAKRAAQDPAAVAKYEFERDILEAKTKAEIAAEKAKQEAVAAREKEVEGLKHKYGLSTLAAKHQNDVGLAGLDNASAERRAGISAAATRYSADKSLEGAKIKSDNKGAGDELRDAENILDTLAKAGVGEKDPVTRQVRPNGLTQRAAQRVNQYRQGGMSFDEAVETTQREMRDAGLLK